MIVFARLTGGDRKFFNGRQAAVCRRDPSAGGFATPEREKIQSRHSEVLPTPGDVYADDGDLSSREFGKAGDRIEKMLEATDVA